MMVRWYNNPLCIDVCVSMFSLTHTHTDVHNGLKFHNNATLCLRFISFLGKQKKLTYEYVPDFVSKMILNLVINKVKNVTDFDQNWIFSRTLAFVSHFT